MFRGLMAQDSDSSIYKVYRVAARGENMKMEKPALKIFQQSLFYTLLGKTKPCSF